MTDFRVRTVNPEALDSTIQAIPGVVCAVVDGTWDGESCTVRVLAGNEGFLRFAIEQQGYGQIIKAGKD